MRGPLDQHQQALFPAVLVVGQGRAGQAFQHEARQVAAGLEAGAGAGVEDLQEVVAGLGAVELGLGRGQQGVDGRVGAAGVLQFAEGLERHAVQQVPVAVDRVLGDVGPGGQVLGGGAEQGRALGLDVGHGGLDQGLAGREVIEHRPARQAGGVGDHRVGGGVVADLGEQAHRLVQNPRAGLLGFRRVLGEAGGVHAGDLVAAMLHRNRLAALEQPQAAKGIAYRSRILTITSKLRVSRAEPGRSAGSAAGPAGGSAGAPFH